MSNFVTHTLLFLLFLQLHFLEGDSALGKSYVFAQNEDNNEGISEIRTPIIPAGSLDHGWTISMWMRNTLPCSIKGAGDTGLNPGPAGGVLSFWVVNEQRVAPGMDWGFENGASDISTTNTPSSPILDLGCWSIACYVNYFDNVAPNYSRWSSRLLDNPSINDNSTFSGPFYYRRTSEDTWYLNSISWDPLASTLTLYSLVHDNVTNAIIDTLKVLPVNATYIVPMPDLVIRIGFSTTVDPGLSKEVDDFCLFNKALSPANIRTIRTGGCNAFSSNLTLHYSFDKDITNMLPNVYDEVSASFNGVSTNAISSLETCFVGMKFGDNIGPHLVSSTAPCNSTLLTSTTSSQLPSISASDDVTLHQQGVTVSFLPSQGYNFVYNSQMSNYNAEYYTFRAMITSITGNADTLQFFDCPQCFNCVACFSTYGYNQAFDGGIQNVPLLMTYLQQFGVNIKGALMSSSSYLIKERTRRIFVVDSAHSTAQATSNVVNFKLVDTVGGNSTNVASMKFNILGHNNPPIASSGSLTTSEDSIAMFTLKDLAFDREGDPSLYEITQLPMFASLYQVVDNGGNTLAVGDEILIAANPSLVSQFVSTSKAPLSSGDIPGMPVSVLQGIPNLASGVTWMLTGTDGWVIVYFDTAVYASSLTIFFQYGPGTTYLIQSTPFDPNMNYANAATNSSLQWDNIWSKSLDQSHWDNYCDGTGECDRSVSYSLFPQIYKTNVMRIYFSIPDLSYMTMIYGLYMAGSTLPISSIVLDKKGRLFVKPKQYYHGVDSFSFHLSDANQFVETGGVPLKGYESTNNNVGLTFTPVHNPPQLIHSDSSNSGIYVFEPNTKYNISSLDTYDVDGNDIIIQLVDVGDAVGVLYVKGSDGIQKAIEKNDKLTIAGILNSNQTTFSNNYYTFSFATMECLNIAPLNATVSFKIFDADKVTKSLLTSSGYLYSFVIKVLCTEDNAVVNQMTIQYPGLKIFLLIISSVGALLCVLTGLIVLYYRNSLLIKSISGSLCLFTIVSCLIGSVSAIYMSGSITSISCAIGRTGVYVSIISCQASLLSKAIRIFYVFNPADKFRPVAFSNFKVSIIFSIFILIEIIIIIIGVYNQMIPQLITIKFIDNQMIYSGDFCVENQTFMLLHLIYSGMVSGIVLLLSIYTKDVPILYNESPLLFRTVLLQIISTIIIFSLNVVSWNNFSVEIQSFFLGMIISFCSLSVILTQFTSRIILILQNEHDKVVENGGTTIVGNLLQKIVSTSGTAGEKNELKSAASSTKGKIVVSSVSSNSLANNELIEKRIELEEAKKEINALKDQLAKLSKSEKVEGANKNRIHPS